MTIVKSADCTETITVMTKMVTACVIVALVRLIHMRGVKKMTEKDLDIAIEKCERIMEFDTRTLKDPVSENGFLFDSVYDLLKFLRQFQFATDKNVGGTSDTISRQAALNAICEDGTQLERQGQYSMTMAERKQRDVDILEALPSAQPGWIPTSERLPKKDGDYLVTTHSGQIARYIFIGGSSEGYWRRCATAWMPLPKPWEGGQS